MTSCFFQLITLLIKYIARQQSIPVFFYAQYFNVEVLKLEPSKLIIRVLTLYLSQSSSSYK